MHSLDAAKEKQWHCKEVQPANPMNDTMVARKQIAARQTSSVVANLLYTICCEQNQSTYDGQPLEQNWDDTSPAGIE